MALGYAGLLPARMDALAIGALIAAALRSGNDFAWLRRVALPLSIVAGVTLLAIATVRREFSPFDTVTFALGLSAFVVLFGAMLIGSIVAAKDTILRRFFENSALRGAGRYSYAMYIFHLLIAMALLDRVLWAQGRFDVSLLRTVGGSQIPTNVAFSLTARSSRSQRRSRLGIYTNSGSSD